MAIEGQTTYLGGKVRHGKKPLEPGSAVILDYEREGGQNYTNLRVLRVTSPDGADIETVVIKDGVPKIINRESLSGQEINDRRKLIERGPLPTEETSYSWKPSNAA